MYYYPNYNLRYNRYQSDKRLFPGGFLVPFGLGLLAAPLVYRPRPNYYYYQQPYYYGPYYY